MAIERRVRGSIGDCIDFSMIRSVTGLRKLLEGSREVEFFMFGEVKSDIHKKPAVAGVAAWRPQNARYDSSESDTKNSFDAGNARKCHFRCLEIVKDGVETQDDVRYDDLPTFPVRHKKKWLFFVGLPQAFVYGWYMFHCKFCQFLRNFQP